MLPTIQKVTELELFDLILARTLRVPQVGVVTSGDSEVLSRQVDIALMNLGFKADRGLLTHLRGLNPTQAKGVCLSILRGVQRVVGGHVAHNTYFRDFPKNIPNTLEFWVSCLTRQLAAYAEPSKLDLLSLPGYGSYAHTYQEMVEAHEALIPSLKAKFKLLTLGGTLDEEAIRLFRLLAESPVPLNEGDLEILTTLSNLPQVLGSGLPSSPVRENRAVVNAARVRAGLPFATDTVTDTLRVAVCLSGGDVTLDKPTKFKSFPRKLRRLLCQGLYSLLVTSPEKVSDVSRYQEMWKRLGEKLHPYEFGLTQVNELFDLARGDKTQKSLQGRIEEAFLAKNWPLVMSLATKAPGVLFRSVDRALVAGCPPATLLGALEETVGKVSCRVLLSLREHLLNRERRNATGKRVFSNTKGKSWIEDETRNPLPGVVVEGLINLLDLEIEARLPTLTNLAVDMKVKGVALPLSEKNKASGFGVLQRGSVSKIEGNVLRFFMYWKEKETRTDYDLSCILLNWDFEMTS
jgi:hypothetical protein